MAKKLIKYVTRNYSLLDHGIMYDSLVGKNNCLPEVRYTGGVDVSIDGLIDIYVYEKDFIDIQKRVLNCVKKDPKYIDKRLKQGISASSELLKLPKDLLLRIENLSDKQIAKELINLRKKFFNFSGFIELTHHLGKLNIALSQTEIEELANLHETRKYAFMEFFAFLKEVTTRIARKKNLNSKDLSFLSFKEIISLLNKKLSAKKADKLQEKRKEKYIMYYASNKEKIISDKFDKEIQKLQKNIIEPELKEIKGLAINKGVVKGQVKLITQKTPLSEIPNDKVIVIQMTNPNLTPVLQKSRAVITDEGGLLCHAANIAREFGIIAIIGTKVATKVLKDGDEVEVDANNGIVKILKSKSKV